MLNGERVQTLIESKLVHDALHDRLVFKPTPLFDESREHVNALVLPKHSIEITLSKSSWERLINCLNKQVLTKTEIKKAIEMAKLSEKFSKKLFDTMNLAANDTREEAGSSRKVSKENDESSTISLIDEVEEIHELDILACLAINVITELHEKLLLVEPLTEIHFHLNDEAKATLAIGWLALVKRGIFPLPPKGKTRLSALQKNPLGAMHFVSASDLDAGYFYTMGIALSAEAQALKSMEVSYGLDGELIVPGQAVSPIPPFLAMGTRLFAFGIATSSNISEEVQSIPIRNYTQFTADSLQPKRGGIYEPSQQFETIDQLVSDLWRQFDRYEKRTQKTVDASTENNENNERFLEPSIADFTLPAIKAAFDVTTITINKIRYCLAEILKDKKLSDQRKYLALYINIEPTATDRIAQINAIVDVAAEFGLKYVAVADNEKDAWLPNLLEYLEPFELNAIADHSDQKGVIVVDGRPIDPIYTAATSAQRIQSVFTTLAVDVLKMGMWLCLDALTARIVYRELLSNPHIPERMLLMPIGIVEPWNAFVDNRRTDKTPRAILDPFEKIKFMIEEATLLGIPSLLTDTRHKETWVLLGRKTDEDEPHPREEFIRDPTSNEILYRTKNSAIPLLSWKEFMACERLARKAGILLGQAGSIETAQLFRIISETTFDAAREGKNPASAVWTAETERVMSTRHTELRGKDLQSQRSAKVSPLLAVINRGYESHAKLEGWLHYLEESGESKFSTLRKALKEYRDLVNQQLETLLTIQTEVQQNENQQTTKDTETIAQLALRYQKAWDDFRAAYLDYHQLIKENFLPVRNHVSKNWDAIKKKHPSPTIKQKILAPAD